MNCCRISGANRPTPRLRPALELPATRRCDYARPRNRDQVSIAGRLRLCGFELAGCGQRVRGSGHLLGHRTNELRRTREVERGDQAATLGGQAGGGTWHEATGNRLKLGRDGLETSIGRSI